MIVIDNERQGNSLKTITKQRIGRLHDVTSCRRELARAYRDFRQGALETDEMRAIIYALKTLHEMLIVEAGRPARLEIVETKAPAIDYDSMTDTELAAAYSQSGS